MKWILCSIFLSICINIIPAQDLMIPYRKDSLWGYANEKGTIITQPKYYRTYFFNGDKYKIVYKKVNNKLLSGVIHANGKEVIAPVYKSINNIINYTYYKSYNFNVFEDEAYKNYNRRNFNQKILIENYFIGAINKDEEQFIDSTGKVLLEKAQNFVFFNKFGEGYFNLLFLKNNKYGIVNWEGKIRMIPKYESLVYLFGNQKADYLIAVNGSKTGLIQMDGKIIIPFANQEIKLVEFLFQKNPLFKVNRNGSNAVFDHNGKKLAGFTEKNIVIDIVNTKGKEGLVYHFQKATDEVRNAEMPVEVGYYQDRVENSTVPPADPGDYKTDWRNTSIRLLNNKPLLIFKKESLFGLMNTTDSSVIIKPVYQELNWCMDVNPDIMHYKGVNLLYGKKDKKFGILNAEGEVIVPIEYTSLSNILYRSTAVNKIIYFIATNKDGLKGVLNDKNETIVPFNYQYILYENYGREDSTLYFYVQNKEGLFGILTNTKQVQIPVENSVLNQIYIEIPNEKTRYFIAKPSGKSYGLKNLENQDILAPVFDSIKEPFYMFEQKNGYGNIQFSNYCFPIKYQSKFGIIKTNGTYLIQPQYDDIFELLNPYEKQDDYFFTTKRSDEQKRTSYALCSGKFGILLDYSLGLEFKSSEINDFNNGLILTTDSKTFLKGLYFSKTKMLIPPVYFNIRKTYGSINEQKNKKDGVVYFSLLKKVNKEESYEDLITNKGVKFFED